MPDFERVLDDFEIEITESPLKKSYLIGYRKGKTRARNEIVAGIVIAYFVIAAIGCLYTP